MKGVKTVQAAQDQKLLSLAGAFQQLPVSLTATNYVAQIAAGGAVNSAGPFTVFSPTRVPQIVLGSGGGTVNYTITGTDLAGNPQSEVIAFTAPATKKAANAYGTITALTSDVNPGGTTDLQAGDTMVSPSARAVEVTGTAGNIAIQLEEDAAVQTVPYALNVERAQSVKRINITNTTAVGIYLRW